MSSTLDPAATPGFDTVALHGGQDGDPATKSRAVPIYQTTSYVFDDTAHAARLFALEEFGNIYTRIMNPTTDVLEQRIAALEGGVGALAVASGQAAIVLLAAQHRARRRSHREFGLALRRHVQRVRAHAAELRHRGRRSSIRTTGELRGRDQAEHQGRLRRNDRQSEARRARRRSVARVAHEPGVPLIVDNTLATPYLLRPIEYGADVVVHSATKFIGGHGTSIGGVIVDAGNFDWSHRDVSRIHRARSVVSRRAVRRRRSAARVHHQGARAVAARCRGGALTVQLVAVAARAGNARLAHGAAQLERTAGRGVSCRGTRRSRGCGIPVCRGDPAYANAQKYLPKGSGAILTFGVKGGAEAARALIDS